MADNEGDENSVVLPSATLLFDSEAPKSEYTCDENSPLCPGEVRMMRNHPKVASVLFSPSRTTRGGEGKIKPKSFSTSLYASPTRKTVYLCCQISQLVIKRSLAYILSENCLLLTCFEFLCQKPNGVEKEKRKTLQVLQPTATGDGTLVGSRGVVRHYEMVKQISFYQSS